MGPYPDVEEEPHEPDLSKVKVGGVRHPRVLELEKELTG